MSSVKKTAAGFLAGALLLGGGTLYAQTPTPPDCPKPLAVEKLSGEVVKLDEAQGMVTIRASDGTMHEFRASRETIQDMKVGEKIEAKLRVSEKCRRG